MIKEMTQVKSIANTHMRRDIGAGGEWSCGCEECQSYRSLAGMDKAFKVRSLVREVQQIEDQLDHLPEGPEKTLLLSQFSDLYDRLAQVMEK